MNLHDSLTLTPRRGRALLTEDFNKQMDSFQVRQFIVIGIHTDTEEKPSVASVYNLEILELTQGTHAWVSPGLCGRTEGNDNRPQRSWIDTFGPGVRLAGEHLPVGESEQIGVWIFERANFPNCGAPHFLIIVIGNIPFGQPCLALTILQHVQGGKRSTNHSAYSVVSV